MTQPTTGSLFEEPATLSAHDGVPYGVLTNTGNLRDILARGMVRPSELRTKHYADYGDLAPEHVVLVRLPLPTKSLSFVVQEAAHLSPVLLLVNEALREAPAKSLTHPKRKTGPLYAMREDEFVVAVPGPLPLTCFSETRFLDDAAKNKFLASARHGEDTLGVPLGIGIEHADSGVRPLPKSQPPKGNPESRRAGNRYLDARAGVLLALSEPAMTAACRHIATRAMHALATSDKAIHPCLGSPPLGGLWDWLCPHSDRVSSKSIDIVAKWLLEHICEAGRWNGFPRERFLAELLAASKVLDIEQHQKDGVAERIESINEVLSFASARSRKDSVTKGPFLGLLEYLSNYEQYDSGNMPPPGSSDQRFARILRAAHVGWNRLDTSENDVALRRAIIHSVCTAFHEENATNVRLPACEVLPYDYEGWLVEGIAGNAGPQKKVLDRGAFDACWDSELKFPRERIQLPEFDNKGKVVVPWRVQVKHTLCRDRLREHLEQNDLDESTRSACEKAVAAQQKTERKKR